MSAGKHTPGPWGWFGTATGEEIYLATLHSGRRYVMSFRRWGLRSAQPAFQVEGKGMVAARHLLQFEVGDQNVVGLKAAQENESVYRYHIRGIAHPDACLISAAPDMLEALEVAEAELENHTSVPGVSEHILPCIRAAIAKAKGDQ